MVKKYCMLLAGLCILCLTSLTSCQNELDKYYELPDWLKGSAWEVLEKDGNYTIFLKGIELSGYQDMVSGKGIITVMAPDDDAFNAYLGQKGYSSINQMPTDELKKLIGFHLVYYSFSQDKMADYNPNSSAPNEVGAQGMYYKFRTKSSDAISQAIDVANNNKEISVYHYERFLPVFSGYIFETKKINAASNYTYFYPNSKWENSSLNQFNVSNSQVDDYAVITDNGFIYHLVSVIEPLETIYTELSKSDDYSIFRDAYDRFSIFEFDATSTEDYGKGDSLYLHTHGTDLPPIAREWSTSSYLQLATLASSAYTIFAPDNAALTKFFNEYWKDGDKYKEFSDLNFFPLSFLLFNHYYSGSLIFPEEIELGRIKSNWDNVIKFDTQSATKKQICVNGALYGLPEVVVPAQFESVLKPLFRYPRFNMHLLLLVKSQMFQTLASEDMNFNLFGLSDDFLMGYADGEAYMYQNLNPLQYGQEDVLVMGSEGWTNISTSAANTLFCNHVTEKLMSSLGGKQVYRTFNSFQYIMVEGNDVWSSQLYNIGDTTRFAPLDESGYNGTSYELSEGSPLLTESRNLKSVLVNATDCPEEYREFSLLVQKAEMHLASDRPAYEFLMGNQFMIFIPTNEVIEANADKFPEDPEELAEVLKYYFVNVDASRLTDYPFPGAGVQGNWQTFRQVDGTQGYSYYGIIMTDKGNELQLSNGVETARVTSYFPYIFADGAAYTIDGILH